jgi:hypothetical protein
MEFEIGYGKPPRATRFQKGRSGNPKGRPKRAAASLAEYCDALEVKKVSVSGSGRPKSRPAYEVAVAQIARKISRGDPDAWSEYAEAMKRHCGEGPPRRFVIIGGLPE